MKKTIAFQCDSITESILVFNQLLRDNDFNIGIEETILISSIANRFIKSKILFSNAVKKIVCKNVEDCKKFSNLFDFFWDSNPTDLREKSKTQLSGSLPRSKHSTIVMVGQGQNEDELNSAKTTNGSNKSERLKVTDFSKISEIEHDELMNIAEMMFKEMEMKNKKNKRKHANNGIINISKTIRKNLNNGGDPIQLFKRKKMHKKNRVVLFLDVSGSMDKYSFFLLKFMIILKKFFKEIEFFLFSTSLVRITKILNKRNIEQLLYELKLKANVWSSGTKMGESLQMFNTLFASQVLNRNPSIVFLSDGLDTSEPELLRNELYKIKIKSKKIIWLNPLKGTENYSPETRSMKTVLPYLDVFAEAHNLKSLQHFEKILMNI